MMDKIKQFFADHKISAHTFVVIWGVADVLWYTNKDFHAYISGLLVALPAWLHGIMFGVIVPVLVYLKTTKKPVQGPNPAVMKAAVLLLATLAMLTATGCNGFERSVFQTLSASRDVIDQAQVDYEARTLPHNQCAYALINNAKAVQTTAVNAMVVYEEQKATKKDLTSQTALVASTIAGLPPLVLQIKTLYTNPAACGGSI